MNPYFAEFIGTAILILLGNGVVANVLLDRTKGHNSGWIVIAAGWAFAVFIGAFCAAPASGAHLNPAVTVAMVLVGKLPAVSAPGYVLAQMLGAVTGGILVYLFYRDHFHASNNPDAKLACFCTGPAIRNAPQSFFCETVGTFLLIFAALRITGGSVTSMTPQAGIGTVEFGSLGFLPVAFIVFAIGLSLGGTTGYAINPARDLGPRLAHALLPIPGKRDSDWSYAWIPATAPVLGGVLAAWAYAALR